VTGKLSAPGFTAARQAVFPRRRGGAEGVYKGTGSLGVPRWAADRFPEGTPIIAGGAAPQGATPPVSDAPEGSTPQRVAESVQRDGQFERARIHGGVPGGFPAEARRGQACTKGQAVQGVYKGTGSLGVPRWAADRFPEGTPIIAGGAAPQGATPPVSDAPRDRPRSGSQKPPISLPSAAPCRGVLPDGISVQNNTCTK
jgi:hypothetical protein